jgi:uncharacterized MAPEG superfamily protein
MTTDLWMLVWSAVLCLVVPYPAIGMLFGLPGGRAWGLGNRDTTLAVPPWVERTRRAHANMLENLAPFACLVLVAHVAGKANATTAFAAELFLGARIVYTLVYMAGVPVLRTLVFGIGVFANLLILVQILR